MSSFESPRSPAQSFALLSGVFLVALGVLSLIFASTSFATVADAQVGEFLIWNATGWTAVLWIAVGAVGLLTAARVDAARSYALAAGVVFAIVAVWGFIDGTSVFGLFVANPVNNITHAVLAVLGLAAGMPSERMQRKAAPGKAAPGVGSTATAHARH